MGCASDFQMISLSQLPSWHALHNGRPQERKIEGRELVETGVPSMIWGGEFKLPGILGGVRMISA